MIIKKKDWRYKFRSEKKFKLLSGGELCYIIDSVKCNKKYLLITYKVYNNNTISHYCYGPIIINKNNYSDFDIKNDIEKERLEN